MDELSPQEIGIRFALQMLGAELVDEAPPGSIRARAEALRERLEAGEITEDVHWRLYATMRDEDLRRRDDLKPEVVASLAEDTPAWLLPPLS